jgi:hypothetical protein
MPSKLISNRTKLTFCIATIALLFGFCTSKQDSEKEQQKRIMSILGNPQRTLERLDSLKSAMSSSPGGFDSTAFFRLANQIDSTDMGVRMGYALVLATKDNNPRRAKAIIWEVVNALKTTEANRLFTVGMAIAQFERDSGMHYCIEAIKLEPNNYVNLMSLTQQYFSYGQNDEALKLVERIITLKPKDSVAIFTRGMILAEKDEFKKAYSDLKHIPSQWKNEGNAYFYRAMCNFYLKHFEEAIPDCSKAISFGSISKKNSYSIRAAARYYLGDTTNAMRDLDTSEVFGNNDVQKNKHELRASKKSKK